MTDREALAYHEAGHAVAHIMTNYPFSYVTIVGNEKQEGHIKPSSVYIMILGKNIRSRKREIVAIVYAVVISLHAGNVAEEIFLGYRAEDESWTDTEDVEAIAKYRSKHPKKWAQRLRRLTRHILEDPIVWDDITTVATALLEKQTLTGEEVHGLLKRDYTWGHVYQLEDEMRRELKNMLANSNTEE